MFLEMFFNELSSSPRAENIEKGQNRAREFVLTIREAAVRGAQPTFRIPEDFFVTDIAPNYNWYVWLSDGGVDIELRRYLRSLATKAPFLRDEPDLEKDWAALDCIWRNQKALGLKAAYIADGLALSLLTRNEWDSPFIECEIQEIVDEDVECRIESVHHASKISHVESHIQWILCRVQSAVHNGRELWQHLDTLFPSLDMCLAVEEQLGELPACSLPSVLRGLFHLNSYCVRWKRGPFEPDDIKCKVSPDTEQTLRMFGAERTFLCPGGYKRTFSWHAKVGAWRIYFDPAHGPGRLLIGYIGKHLRTVKFR